MTPPSWFYPLLAVCLVTLSGAATWRMLHSGRYVMVEDSSGLSTLDTHTGWLCTAADAPARIVCFAVNHANEGAVISVRERPTLDAIFGPRPATRDSSGKR